MSHCRIHFALAAAGCAALTVFAPSSAWAGGFPAENVALYSQITPGQFGSSFATDCWGWTSPSGREYAIICLNDKTAVVEITNPTLPIIVGTVSHQNSGTGDVKVYQGYAYAANGDGGGIDIIDLTDVDNGNVSLVQRMTAGGVQASHNIAINEDSGYLYLGIGNINGGDLVAFNLSNPEAPFVDGEYDGERSHDLQVITYTQGPYAGREIAFSFAEGDGFEIIDVTDKGNMFLRSSRTYSNVAYCHQGWVSEDRQYVYLDDELDGIQRTTVFDISDLDDPFFVDDFSSSAPTAIDHNLYVRDGFIFEANYTSGLRIFDSCDPVNPVEVGFFDTYPANDSADFAGAWSNYPFFPSGTVIVSDRSGGLFVLDVSDAVAGATTPPDSFSAFRGFLVSGGLADVLESDDNDLCHNPGIVLNPSEAPITLDFEGTLPSDSPASLEVTIESTANTVGLELTVSFWNYNTDSWDVVGTATQSLNNDVARTYPGNPADHVEPGTGAVMTRYEVRVVSFIFQFPWTDCIDHVFWTTAN